jgi:hypothetical protein
MKLKDVPLKAFPHKQPLLQHQEWCGMDLRDYFAAKAIVPLIQSQGKVITSPDDVAELAYMFADALIEKRKQK